MKRIHIIKKLLSEGFTERTLSMLDDKQLISLNKIMVNEQPIGSVIASKKTPITDIKNLTKGGLNVELREKNNKEEKEEEEEVYRSRRKRGLKNRSSKLVEKLVENKYFHNFTSKGDIVKLIKSKLNEVNTGPNVKTGHNGVPEFMTYDSITKSDMKENESDTKTKPGTKNPDVKPHRPTPYSPTKPGKKSSPKGLKENEPDTKTKPGTKNPDVKPHRPTPYSPTKPGKKSLPKGLKEKKDENK